MHDIDRTSVFVANIMASSSASSSSTSPRCSLFTVIIMLISSNDSDTEQLQSVTSIPQDLNFFRLIVSCVRQFLFTGSCISTWPSLGQAAIEGCLPQQMWMGSLSGDPITRVKLFPFFSWDLQCWKGISFDLILISFNTETEHSLYLLHESPSIYFIPEYLQCIVCLPIIIHFLTAKNKA